MKRDRTEELKDRVLELMKKAPEARWDRIALVLPEEASNVALMLSEMFESMNFGTTYEEFLRYVNRKKAIRSFARWADKLYKAVDGLEDLGDMAVKALEDYCGYRITLEEERKKLQYLREEAENLLARF